MATEARPGSEEKIRVMESRYLAGEPLFQADDAFIGVTREDNGYGEPSMNNPRQVIHCEPARHYRNDDEFRGES